MGARYAEVADIILHYKDLTAKEIEQAESLLDIASAKLRITAEKYGKDIDKMIAENSDIGYVVKDIVISACKRALSSNADAVPSASQSSQSALGYTVSMTYLNAGQSLYFLRNELKELGMLRQKFGGVEVYKIADDKGD